MSAGTRDSEGTGAENGRDNEGNTEGGVGGAAGQDRRSAGEGGRQAAPLVSKDAPLVVEPLGRTAASPREEATAPPGSVREGRRAR